LPYIGNTPAEKYAAFDVQYFTTSATTSYTLDHAVANELDIRLVINNVIQEPGSGKAYTATGTTLTLSAATAGTDTMYCVYTAKASQTVNPGAGSVGADQLSANAITGQTALGGTPADTDELLVSDAGVLKRVDYSYLKGVTLSTNTNDQVATVTGPNALNGEANLRFTGSTLRVGSGTTSPDSNASDVVVEGSANTGISILSGGTNTASLYLGTNGANNDGVVGYDNDNNDLYFHANAAQKFRVNSNGDVQIGMQSWGNAPSASNYGVEFNNTNFGSTMFGSGTGTNNHITFGNPNGVCGSISTSGSNTAFNTSSDYRLKENQVAISDGITRLKTLKPYRFNFKADAEKTVDGFFAHEVSSVVPEAITGDKDAMVKVYYEKGDTIPEDKNIGDFKEYSTSEISPQAIDQSKLVPLLTSALQEAITKIETLEAKVTTLENA